MGKEASKPAITRRKKILIVASLSLVVILMLGATFASAPLYRIFCQITGFAGTPKKSTNEIINNQDLEQSFQETKSSSLGNKKFTVRFDANIAPNLNYEFYAIDKIIEVDATQQYKIKYHLKNLNDSKQIGLSSFNVSPFKAAPYFVKVECFCYDEIEIEAKAEKDLEVIFYIDPLIYSPESDASEVSTITLSYTFFEVVLD